MSLLIIGIKNSVLALEEQFARPALEKRLVKSFKARYISNVKDK